MLKFSHHEKHAVEDLVKNIGKLSLGGAFILTTLWYAQTLAAEPVHNSASPLTTVQASGFSP